MRHLETWRGRAGRRLAGLLVLISALGCSTQAVIWTPTVALADTTGVSVLANNMVRLNAAANGGGLAASLVNQVKPLLPGVDWNVVMFGGDELTAAQQQTAQVLIPDLSGLESFIFTPYRSQTEATTAATHLIETVVAEMQSLNSAISSSDAVTFLTVLEGNTTAKMLEVAGKSHPAESDVQGALRQAFTLSLSVARSSVQSLFPQVQAGAAATGGGSVSGGGGNGLSTGTVTSGEGSGTVQTGSGGGTGTGSAGTGGSPAGLGAGSSGGSSGGSGAQSGQGEPTGTGGKRGGVSGGVQAGSGSTSGQSGTGDVPGGKSGTSGSGSAGAGGSEAGQSRGSSAKTDETSRTASLSAAQRAFAKVITSKVVGQSAATLRAKTGGASVTVQVRPNALATREKVSVVTANLAIVRGATAHMLPKGYQAVAVAGIRFSGPAPRKAVTVTLSGAHITAGAKVYEISKTRLVPLKATVTKGKAVVSLHTSVDLVVAAKPADRT